MRSTRVLATVLLLALPVSSACVLASSSDDEASGAVGGGFLPELPQVRFSESESEDAEITEAQIVAAAYAGFADAIRRSGYEIEIETGDAVTYYRDDFDRVYWPDVVTVGADAMLSVSHGSVNYGTELSHSGTKVNLEVGVFFDPQWDVKTEPDDLLGLAYHRADVASTTLDTVAENSDGQFGDSAQVLAITSYRVRLAFEDRKVSYRAAIFWYGDERGGPVRWHIEDRVSAFSRATLDDTVLIASPDELMAIGHRKVLEMEAADQPR